MPVFRYRLLATLLFLGAAFLLYRTIAMLAGGAIHILVPWVVALLFLELVIDGVTMGMCLLWGVTLSRWHGMQVFRLTAAVVIVHAVRVLVFVAHGSVGGFRCAAPGEGGTRGALVLVRRLVRRNHVRAQPFGPDRGLAISASPQALVPGSARSKRKSPAPGGA